MYLAHKLLDPLIRVPTSKHDQGETIYGRKLLRWLQKSTGLAKTRSIQDGGKETDQRLTRD